MWRNMHNLHYADKSLGRNLTYCYGNGSSEANLFIYFFFSLNALACDLSSHSNNIFFYSFIFILFFLQFLPFATAHFDTVCVELF